MADGGVRPPRGYPFFRASTTKTTLVSGKVGQGEAANWLSNFPFNQHSSMAE